MDEKNRASGTFREEGKTPSARAVDILNGWFMVSKNMKIFSPDNRLVRNQVTSLFRDLQAMISGEGEAAFTLKGNTLYLNGRKILFGFSNYHLFKFFSGKLNMRDIGMLGIRPGLTEEELRESIFLLGSKDPESKDPFTSFSSRLRAKGIRHVVVEKAQSLDRARYGKASAKKAFLLGITHLKESFEILSKEEKIPLSTTRRLMQSLFDHLTNDESFLYGITTIKNFDEYTLNHSLNVCILSISLGKRLGLDRNELADLGISAFFHDFGKTEIPRDILVKPGKLDEREREIIEHHPRYGAEKLIRLMEYSRLPVRAVNVAMEHHVNEDLTGYPRYQRKRHVNLFSKIVKICDFYDALTTKRPYRDRVFTTEETLNMMKEKSGVEFDPFILKVFADMMGTYPVGTLVLLDTGEIGIVFEVHPDPLLPSRPKVKIIADAEGRKIDGEIVDLTEKSPRTGDFIRTIVKSLDPHRYGISVPDYFLIQAQT